MSRKDLRWQFLAGPPSPSPEGPRGNSGSDAQESHTQGQSLLLREKQTGVSSVLVIGKAGRGEDTELSDHFPWPRERTSFCGF